MNILLTGARGFVGKNLKKYFQNKYNLLAPTHDELNLIDENIVKNYFSLNDIDLIIHCASVGGDRIEKDKLTTVDENLAMFDNLIKFRKNNCKIILFLSGAMYDKKQNLHKVKEETVGVNKPKDLYGLSKMLIAQKLKSLKNVLALTIFACYGYDEKITRFPSYVINQVLNKQDIVINQNVIFDYLFIEDLFKVVEYFILNEGESKIINVTPTQSVSLEKIANIINSFDKDSVNIKILNKGVNNEYSGDNTLLLKEIKEFMFTPIEEGLKKLYLYIKKQRENL